MLAERMNQQEKQWERARGGKLLLWLQVRKPSEEARDLIYSELA